MNQRRSIMSAKNVETAPENAAGIFIPLNKLKKSPKNARKTPHSEAAIEAYAASIAAKGILQNLVVEPELDGEGAETGFYFVTIGKGVQLVLLLWVERKEIKKTDNQVERSIAMKPISIAGRTSLRRLRRSRPIRRSILVAPRPIAQWRRAWYFPGFPSERRMRGAGIRASPILRISSIQRARQRDNLPADQGAP
jgi:hypothetical protein